jgi:mevalonate kinase
MNRIKILLICSVIFVFCPMGVLTEESETTIDQEEDKLDSADQPDKPDQASESDPKLAEAVREALKAVKKESPQVNEDSLRVWKNFKSSSKPVNYTYRFWGRRLILWLKDEKKMTFQSEKEVGEVFKVLWRDGLISSNAVVVLMVDTWSYLIYLEGSPSWERRMENQSPQKKMGSLFSNQGKQRERSA